MDEDEKRINDETEQEKYKTKQQGESQEKQNELAPSVAPTSALISAYSAINKISPALPNVGRVSTSLSVAVKHFLETQNTWRISVLPLISPSLQSYCQSLAKDILDNYPPMSDAMNSLIASLKDVLSSYTFQLPQIASPVLEMFKNISQIYLQSISETLKGIDFSFYRKHLNHLILCETFDAKWVPNAVWDAEPDLLSEVLSIIRSTKKSKNRVKMIDKAIFNYYSKGRIESIKKAWRGKGIPEYSMRMMHQAVQAYHRREYAITVVMLSTMWEGIIYEKAHDARGKNCNRTKSNFEKLIEQNDFDELFQSFFEEYVMYDCRSVEQVIEDVPGRNSSAHSWYNKYPSRKAALNAILFTDLLLKLEPIFDEAEGPEYADA